MEPAEVYVHPPRLPYWDAFAPVAVAANVLAFDRLSRLPRSIAFRHLAMKAALRRSSRPGREASTRQGRADMAMAQRLVVRSYASEMLLVKVYAYRRAARSTRLAII
jgi:hypothetical protein